GGRVAEKRGHGNQQVIEQTLDFLRVLAQEVQIVIQPGTMVELHPASQSAQDGRPLVAREIMPGARAYRLEDALQGRLVALIDVGFERGGADEGSEPGATLRQLGQTTCELTHRQYNVRYFGSDDCSGHAFVHGFTRVLYQDYASCFLH